MRAAPVKLPLRWTGRGEADLDLLDHHDVPWIAELVGLAATHAGRAWRELRALADGKWRIPVLAALERACAEQREREREAGATRLTPPEARALLFGVPICDPAEHAHRIATIAHAHHLTTTALAAAAWTDVASEALVDLPAELPSPRALATAANIAMVQQVFARAHELRVERDDRAGGAPKLLPGPRGGASARSARALAAELVTFARFRVEARCRLRSDDAETTIRVRSPPEAITLA